MATFCSPLRAHCPPPFTPSGLHILQTLMFLQCSFAVILSVDVSSFISSQFTWYLRKPSFIHSQALWTGFLFFSPSQLVGTSLTIPLYACLQVHLCRVPRLWTATRNFLGIVPNKEKAVRDGFSERKKHRIWENKRYFFRYHFQYLITLKRKKIVININLSRSLIIANRYSI